MHISLKAFKHLNVDTVLKIDAKLFIVVRK